MSWSDKEQSDVNRLATRVQELEEQNTGLLDQLRDEQEVVVRLERLHQDKTAVIEKLMADLAEAHEAGQKSDGEAWGFESELCVLRRKAKVAQLLIEATMGLVSNMDRNEMSEPAQSAMYDQLNAISMVFE